MSARLLTMLTVLMSATAVFALGVAIIAPVAPSSIGVARASATAVVSVRVNRYPAESLGGTIVGRDVFRRSRLPPTLAYDPNRSLLPVGPPSPKPVLQLVGLTGGAQPSAVIEGFPGIDGSRVVRSGDQVGALRVTAIRLDAVTVVGLDTTWVLRLREPWR